MIVICVIGDLVGSRLVTDRQGLQKRLKLSLKAINESHNEHILSPCTITLGDEYQVVYRDADALFQDFLLIMRNVFPGRIRFSVGIGSLTTSLNTQQAIGMDGPAFHVARAAMNESFKGSRKLFRVNHADGNVPPWMEAALSLVSHEIASWKQKRFHVFQLLLAGNDVKSIARKTKISPTAVYKNIQSGGLEAIHNLLLETTKWINSQVRS